MMATNQLSPLDDQNYTFDAVLYATGRKPNTTNIGLEQRTLLLMNAVLW